MLIRSLIYKKPSDYSLITHKKIINDLLGLKAVAILGRSDLVRELRHPDKIPGFPAPLCFLDPCFHPFFDPIQPGEQA